MLAKSKQDEQKDSMTAKVTRCRRSTADSPTRFRVNAPLKKLSLNLKETRPTSPCHLYLLLEDRGLSMRWHVGKE